MSLADSAKSLWSRAPIWRGMIVGASLFTAIGLFTLLTGAGGGGNPPPQPVSTPTPVPTPQPPPSPIAGSCAPAGSQPQQATPPNVVVVGPSGPSAETIARITEFEGLAAAATAEQRQGERCALLSTALSVLESTDLATLRCDAASFATYQSAQSCQADIVASDRRLDALEAAFAAYSEDRSADQVGRLARAGEALTGFDRSRERHNAMPEAIRVATDASARIDESDARLAALEAAAQAASAAGPDHAASTAALADAAEAISAFDTSRMTAAQSGALEDGRAAAARVSASEARLAELRSALALASSGAPGTEQALIDAVAALTPFDTARATSAQAADIASARTLAVSIAQTTLVESAAGLDVATASPTTHQRLANLRSVIEANGGLSPEADATTRSAYGTAEIAAARLAESDRRIARLIETATAWERNPGTGLTSGVRTTMAAIGDYDRARFSDEASAAFETVSGAEDILQAMEQGLDPATRSVAPVYVVPLDDTAGALLAADRLRTALVQAGYRVVDRREASALTFELGFLGETRQPLTVGSTRVETSVVTLSLAAAWTYGEDPFLRETVQGEGRSFSTATVTEDAIDNGVEELIEALEAEVAR